MDSEAIDETAARDNGLAQRITVYLQGRLGSQVRDLRITLQENGLILQGRVRSYYGKQVVQHVAMEMSGLAIAANEIKVFKLDNGLGA